MKRRAEAEKSDDRSAAIRQTLSAALEQAPAGGLARPISGSAITGQTHMARYMRPLLEPIQKGGIDPSFIICHRSTDLEEGPALHEAFRNKTDNRTKVVFKPHD